MKHPIKKNVIKIYILTTVALYIPFYHVAKVFFEASLLILLPYLILNHKRQDQGQKEFLVFLATIAFYCISFLVAYTLKKSDMDIAYAINIIRIAVPLTIIYYAATISSPISIRELILTLSISLILTFTMIVSPWYESNFSGRITLGTNLLLIYGTALAATIILISTTLLMANRESKRYFILPAIALVLGILALLASNAKGAILATIAMLTLISFTQVKTPRSFLTILILISIILISAYSHKHTRVQLIDAYQQVENYFSPGRTTVSGSQGDRLEMWRGALTKISDSPFAINGNMKLIDSFQQEIKGGNISYKIGNFKHVHNDYLQSWMSRGPIGFISLILMMIIPIMIIQNKSLKMMAFSFVGIYSLTSITSVPFLHVYSLRYYCLVVTLILISDKQLKDKEKI
ncbi:O-antigen ligase family protein [Bacterioplanoides sp.]|uniref:O-antigen ligase family protein n=1 Tax=Bacterioplanoides sp. TaxID=2066072 RepID=UPI003B008413